MGLFQFLQPKHLHPDPDIRLAAVNAITDIKILVETAKTDTEKKVRIAALNKIADEIQLVEIAKEAKDMDVRLGAIEKIDNQKLLAEIIRTRKNYDIMRACFEKITDDSILKSIAEDDHYNITARRIAIDMFADQWILVEIARAVKDPGVQEAAIEKLSDEKVRNKLRQELEEKAQVPCKEGVLTVHADGSVEVSEQL